MVLLLDHVLSVSGGPGWAFSSLRWRLMKPLCPQVLEPPEDRRAKVTIATILDSPNAIL